MQRWEIGREMQGEGLLIGEEAGKEGAEDDDYGETEEVEAVHLCG